MKLLIFESYTSNLQISNACVKTLTLWHQSFYVDMLTPKQFVALFFLKNKQDSTLVCWNKNIGFDMWLWVTSPSWLLKGSMLWKCEMSSLRPRAWLHEQTLHLLPADRTWHTCARKSLIKQTLKVNWKQTYFWTC